MLLLLTLLSVAGSPPATGLLESWGKDAPLLAGMIFVTQFILKPVIETLRTTNAAATTQLAETQAALIEQRKIQSEQRSKDQRHDEMMLASLTRLAETNERCAEVDAGTLRALNGLMVTTDALARTTKDLTAQVARNGMDPQSKKEGVV